MNINENFKFYSLTHPQKRIWYVENIYENTVMYNIGGYLKIEGEMNFDLLEEVINILIEKNDALRFRFIKKDENFVQYIKKFERIVVQRIDFSHYENPNEILDKWTMEEMKNSISLTSDELYSFTILKIADEECGLFLKMHHIISDGCSFSIVSKQICDLYSMLVNEEDLSTYKFYSYVDFIDSEQNYINSTRFFKDKKFWSENFSNLPEKSPAKNVSTLRGQRKTYYINKHLSKQIKDFANTYDISLNTFFTAVLIIYMSKKSHKEDIILGIPLLNRTSKKERQMIGMFTSTMPFRYKLDGDYSIDKFMKNVHKELLTNFLHQKYPYDLLVQDLELSKNGYDSLFDICVNYYNTSIYNEINMLPVKGIELYSGEQLYSLQLIVKEFLEIEDLSLSLDYKTNDYSNEQIEKLYIHLNHIIDTIIENPEEKISKINLLSKKEKEKLQFEFNATETEYPKDKTIYELFEKQVEKTPDKIAISFNGMEMTYKNLNEKSNQFARKLKNKGLYKNKIVGFMTTHSLDTIVGILAILKAGGAYVPIDPEYPADRIQYIVDDSAISLLVTNCEVNKNLHFDGEIINLRADSLFSGECCNLGKMNTRNDLAYVIYTSGSTGKPKGAMIEHGGLVNYIWWAKKNYIKSEDEIFAFYSSLSFDLTVTSIFSPLIGGK